ncbi:MAG: tripartite tricarboxylate transporter substrate binding protein [Burkholderiaceae bacterium]|nr:tripartite tricarboxylate transporter substrate binding protein [Burkholderiaceae bacterium]
MTAPRGAALRALAAMVLTCAGLGLAGTAMAQDFPSRSISMYVGNPAGGPTDLVARMLAEKLQTKFGQAVVVENKPGANTLIALNQLMASPPDGYRVMVMASGVTYQSVIDKSVKVDFVNDFEPVGIIMTGDYAYFAPANAPYGTMEELLAWLKANPGKGNYANASGDLVSISLFKAMTGTQFEVVRYNGATKALQAVIAGEATFSGGVPVSTVKALHDAGRVRLLAMAGSHRSPLTPDIPALGESKNESLRMLSQYGGFAGFWLSIVAPKSTPPAIIVRWNTALREVLSEPEVRAKVRELGMTAEVSTPAEMKRRISVDVPRWTKVARDSGIQAE